MPDKLHLNVSNICIVYFIGIAYIFKETYKMYQIKYKCLWRQITVKTNNYKLENNNFPSRRKAHVTYKYCELCGCFFLHVYLLLGWLIGWLVCGGSRASIRCGHGSSMGKRFLSVPINQPTKTTTTSSDKQLILLLILPISAIYKSLNRGTTFQVFDKK